MKIKKQSYALKLVESMRDSKIHDPEQTITVKKGETIVTVSLKDAKIMFNGDDKEIILEA